MGLDLSGLPDYVKQNKNDLIASTVAGAKSIKLFELQTGYKSKATINILGTDVIFQDGKGCGRTPNGTTTVSQRELEVGEIRVDEDICVNDLNAKYLQEELAAGSADDKLPFEEKYTALKVKKINQATEVAIWQGDKLSGDPNLSRFDGFNKIIDAEAGVVNGNISGATSFTKANAIAIIDDMYASIPSNVLDAQEGSLSGGDSINDVAILIGSDWFRVYILALKSANLYHYDGQPSAMEIVIPGTNIKLIGLPGLNGTERIFAGRIGNEGGFVIGTDLEGEYESFEMKYDEFEEVVKFKTKFKMGTQIKFPEEIVEFTLSV